MKSFDIAVVAIKRTSIAIAIGTFGLVGLVTGVVLPSVPVGVVGFLVMLAGGLVSVRAIPVITWQQVVVASTGPEPLIACASTTVVWIATRRRS